MTRLQQFGTFGQSPWLDFISRRAIQDGTLDRLIKDGIVGMTSNPAIFSKAMSGTDYDAEIAQLAIDGKDAMTIYETLAMEDVRAASVLLEGAFHESKGMDGYVSLEVLPTLARDTAGTVKQAIAYWHALKRPNVMIKIPATVEGLPAVAQTIAAGVNVNVTLLFSVERYEAIIDAYMSGLESAAAAGKDLSKIWSVASFFLSRIDVMLDKDLEAMGSEAKALEGKAGVDCAKLAYEAFEKSQASPRWKALAAKGGNPQRLLWASTSTKNPAYPDLMYVEPIIGPLTVNTLTPETIEAILDHASPADRVKEGLAESHARIKALEGHGVNFTKLADLLEEEGLVKFVEPFSKLEELLEGKRATAVAAGTTEKAVLALAGAK